ncbi:lipoxygenase [Grimontia sp. AD028]|uniref:lipoxygenase family protein n=1 Tax=Grimontia sp. AD028 TaxID=1581149 RepID=UPI00061B0284|nr:lipoxygenase family protein [Grimontia sp. AD028]KKD57873.1 lipoxygenase [Grimontia sp. AD028]
MSDNKIEELQSLLNVPDPNATAASSDVQTRSLFGAAQCHKGTGVLADILNALPPGGLGGNEEAASPYPPVSLPQYDFTTSAQRAYALSKARKENTFEYLKLPGAVVHGNVQCEDVANANEWRYRGGLDEQEYNFDVNDADPNFAGVRLFEGTVAYLEKHFWTIVLSPDIAAKFINLLTVVYSELADGRPERITFEIMDPILLTFPHRKCNTVDELDFYPTFCTDHPKYEERIKQWPKAPYDKDFRSDDLIGWLVTAAPTPVFNYFKPYTHHMSKFPITNSHFRRVQGFESDNLDQAMAEGRLFILDFADFHDETVAKRNFDNFGARLHAGICLFAIPANGTGLKTIAIQPTQTPQPGGFWNDIGWFFLGVFGYGDQKHPPSKIITAGDNYWAWQMAKNCITTMTSMAGVIDHLSTHVYLGPIPVAYFRNITEYHPLRPLLDTHLMALVTNNHIGIFEEVGTSGLPNGEGYEYTYGNPYNGLLTGAIQRLSGFSSTTFVNATLRRKNHYHFFEHSTPIDRMADPVLAQLDEYPQHDDNGLAPIINEWVDGYLRLYYHSDQDVKDDTELQGFLYETTHYGNVRGFPDHADTLEELIDIVSRIIYWMSVNHAFGSMVSFMKLSALGVYRDHPIDPHFGYTERDWLNICPPMNVGAGLFMFSRIFTDLPEDWHRSLGKYPKGQFKHDPNVYPLLDVFQQQLQALDDEIREKNSRRRWAYDLRMPSTITVSPWN